MAPGQKTSSGMVQPMARLLRRVPLSLQPTIPPYPEHLLLSTFSPIVIETELVQPSGMEQPVYEIPQYFRAVEVHAKALF